MTNWIRVRAGQGQGGMMKVKCQYCGGNGYVLPSHGFGQEEQEPDKCPECDGKGQIDIEVSTPDLIAELAKRRPCERCKDYQQIVCGNCVWDSLGQEDNFKEAA